MWADDQAYRLNWHRDEADPLTVRWEGYLHNSSGYGEEGRGYALGLSRRGWDLGVATFGDDPVFVESMRPDDRRTLEQAVHKGSRGGDIVVENVVPTIMGRRTIGRYHIGRTMFETAGLPAQWLPNINQMDEIWVPTAFSVETFRAAGVRVPVHVVPAGVDEELYRPGLPKHAIALEAERVFLAVSAVGSDSRSGWDVLLRAWATAFGPSDDVVLVLKISPPSDASGTARRTFDEWIDRVLAGAGRTRGQCARILVLADLVAPEDVPGLYCAATAVLAPLRGTAFGRPLVEAMACEVPVIATGWSAIVDIVTPDTGFLIDVESLIQVPATETVEVYRGQTWAQPSAASLARHLNDVADGAADDGALGRRGRINVLENWTWGGALDVVEERLRAIDGRTVRRSSRREGSERLLRWEGDQYQVHSLAQVNREVLRHFSDESTALDLSTREVDPDPDLVENTEVRLRESTGRSTGQAADVTVRHQWPPDWTPPAVGSWVVVQPWEYGAVPQRWIEGAEWADEVWCYTTWVRDSWALGGFPSERLRVIPLGVDAEVFTPWGEVRPTTRPPGVSFLFCGGMLPRKGIDVLVTAYVEEFEAHEAVTLIVKAHGTKSHYAGGDFVDRLRRISEDADLPTIEIIDDELSVEELAALYRTCDVLVHPYRGEGFGLPVLEAMSSGVPVIVTAGGATGDFCDDSTAWLVDAELVAVDNMEQGPSSAAYFWAEPDKGSLRRRLREAFDDPEGRARRGRAGRERAAQHFTWKHTADRVAGAVAELGLHVPLRERPEPFLDTRNQQTLLHVPRRPLADDALVTAYLSSSAHGLCLVLAVPVQDVGDVAGEVERLASSGDSPEVLLVPCTPEDLPALRSVTRWSTDESDAPTPPFFWRLAPSRDRSAPPDVAQAQRSFP